MCYRLPITAIDKTKIHYVPINDKRFDKCMQISPSNLICKQEQPTVIANNMDNCELKLFTNSSILPKNCDQRIIHSVPCIVIQLNNGKEWLFVAPKPVTVTINCKFLTDPLHFDIVGTGKLFLNSSCMGYTNQFKLTP